MSAPDTVAAASLAHDLYGRGDGRGEDNEGGEVRLARWVIVTFGVLSVFLAVALHNWSIVSLSSFAVALTASAVLPALVYSLLWKGYTRSGLLWTVYGALACCILLELFSPTVSGTPYSLFPEQDFHWFPLQNNALRSVPVGFFLGWAGSRRNR
ncbi:hypothetical protein [Streptomyces sp. NPDC051636]|uniref:sodium:solute symporter family transporter n=1 Tax=Streptomyces sp. NPDC051636 TaxID=3365663 RepID=UPI0037ABE4BB